MKVHPFSVFLSQCKSGMTVLFCGLFLLNLLLKIEIVEDICIWLVCAVLILSLWQIRGISRMIGYLLFGVSILLLLTHQAPLSIWMDGIHRNIYMLVMFALTPLMNIPISKGGYNEALQNFLAAFLERKSSFSMFITSLSSLVGVILNVATIPLMLTIGSQQKQKPDYRLLCTSVARGYSLSVFWGPTFAAVALPLELTGARWVDYFPCALVISLFTLFSTYAFNCLREKRENAAAGLADAPPKGKLAHLSLPDRKKLKELSVWWVIILSFIVVFSWLSGLNTINVVSIASLFFPIIWMKAIGHLDIYKKEFTQNYLPKSLPNMNSEIVLFAGAGFLATAFDFSHAVDFIPSLLSRLTGGHALPFIVLALAIIVVLSIVGVHAMIPVIVLGSAITPEAYGLTPLALTFILTSGWTLSIFLSSSATVSILIASFMRKDTFSVSVGWNWKYGLYMFTLFCISIYGINLLYGA